MYVRLEHDEPHARRRKLRLAVVESRRNVPKRDSNEEAVDDVQDELKVAGREGGAGGEGGWGYRRTMDKWQWGEVDVGECAWLGGGSIVPKVREHRLGEKIGGC